MYIHRLPWWLRRKESTAMQDTRVWSLGRFPGEGNAYPFQYSCLENSMQAWRRLQPARPQPMGLQRVGQDWVTNTHTQNFFSWFLSSSIRLNLSLKYSWKYSNFFMKPCILTYCVKNKIGLSFSFFSGVNEFESYLSGIFQDEAIVCKIYNQRAMFIFLLSLISSVEFMRQK